MKKARNLFYRTVRKAKRECWQKFLLGEEELQEGDLVNIHREDKNRCWKALKYTKPRTNCTTPALQGPNGEVAITMQAKEALVRAHAFPKAPAFQGNEYQPRQGSAHLSVSEETVGRALLCQSIKKSPGPNMHNFQALRLIWIWDSARITSLVQQAIRLQYHPRLWRHAKGILLEKPNKRDRTLVKSYRVISLLNCFGKVVEKLVAEKLSQYCEAQEKLHKGQMGGRKHRSAIDAAAVMIHKVHGIWKDKQIAGALLMDVKGAFDYVSRTKLVQRMRDLGIDDDLIGWTKSFLTDRSVELVIDGFTNPRQEVESGIPQGSPVSPILFLIYISGVFSIIEDQLPQITCLSFIDDLGFLTADRSVSKIAKTLEKVGQIALEWGANNAVTYDTSKTEAVLFSRARRQKLTKLLETRVRVGGETVCFKKEATRWLGVWLDSNLNFAFHVNERIKKAKAAEAQIKGLSKTFGLCPGLVRRIQVAAVQSVALYGAELWWKNQKNYEKDLQKLINRQARSITGMYRSSPISPLMNDSGLLPAHILLDSRQRAYAHRILCLPDSVPTKDILPTTLRTGDGNAQPEELPEYDLVWSTNQRIRTYGQHLAKQVSTGFSIDPAEGVEPILAMPVQFFPGKICIEERSKAIETAKKADDRANLSLWCDGSKLDQGEAGAAVVWKLDNEWLTQKVTLGKNKEIFDAEMWGISEAVKIAEQKCLKAQQPLVISIFCDSQHAINRLKVLDCKAGQALKAQIYQKVKQII